MKTIFRVNISDQRKQLILRVGEEMGIEQYRGYALFDDSDYVEYLNPKWRKRALHFNVRRGVEEISPDHILELFNDPECDHFVWLSKRIVESERVHMLWIYAHELRHVIQDTLYPGLSEMTEPLLKALHDGSAKRPTSFQIEMPQECDAELGARDVVVKMFGDEEYRTYRRREEAANPQAANYFRRFDELAAHWSGDPIADTRRITLSL
jgi:hypothetical protein